MLESLNDPYHVILRTKGQLLEEPDGFMEIWPVTFEQLGRIACSQFNYWEANGGPVSYVAEVYAENTETFRSLIEQAYERFKPTFVAWHRKGKDLVVYRRPRWAKEKQPQLPTTMR